MKEFETHQSVVLDLSKMRRIDESAMEKLKTLEAKATSLGKSLTFVNINPYMANRFEKFYKVL